jgi:hypothetical protein
VTREPFLHVCKVATGHIVVTHYDQKQRRTGDFVLVQAEGQNCCQIPEHSGSGYAIDVCHNTYENALHSSWSRGPSQATNGKEEASVASHEQL